MTENELRILIRTILDETGFSAFKKEQQEIKSSLGDIAKYSAVAFGAVAAGLGFATKQAMDSERALNRARTAVQINKEAWEKWKGPIEDVATAMMNATVVGDEDVIDMTARMITAIGDVDKAYQHLPLALDLARAFQLDNENAARMVAAALEGETGRLAMLIPAIGNMSNELGENATKSQRAEYMLRILQERIGGFAQEEVKTAAGQLQQMKNQLGEVAEAVGKVFMPAITDAITGIRDIAKASAEWIEQNGTIVRVLGEFALSSTAYIASIAGISLALANIPAAIHAVGAAFAWLAAHPAGLIIASLGAVAVAFYKVRRASQDAILDIESSRTATMDFTEALWDATNGGTLYAALLEQVTETAREHNLSIQSAASQIEALKIQYPDVIARTNAWLHSIYSATDGIEKQNEKIEINATALRDLMNAGMAVRDAMAWASHGAVLPNTEVETEAPEVFGPEYDPMALAMQRAEDMQTAADLEKQMIQEGMDAWVAAEIMKTSQTNAEAQSRFDIWQAERDRFLEITNSMQDSYRVGIQSIIDMDMTGKERREAIWNTFKSSAIRHIADVTAKYLFGKMAEQAANKMALAVSLTTTTKAAAAETISAKISAAAWTKVAYAKMIAFYSWLGPGAIGAAGGTIAAAIAGMQAAGAAAVAGFQEGGIVPGHGSGDKVLARLESGEYVNKRGVTERNRPVLDYLNSGGSMRLAPAYAHAAPITFTGGINLYSEGRLSREDKFDMTAWMERELPRVFENLVDARRIDLRKLTR